MGKSMVQVQVEGAAGVGRGMGWDQIAAGEDGSGIRVGYALRLPSLDGLSAATKVDQLRRELGAMGWSFISSVVEGGAVVVTFRRAA